MTRPDAGQDVERLTRPIVGIAHRTAAEVFDIMCARIRLAALPDAGEVERAWKAGFNLGQIVEGDADVLWPNTKFAALYPTPKDSEDG